MAEAERQRVMREQTQRQQEAQQRLRLEEQRRQEEREWERKEETRRAHRLAEDEARRRQELAALEGTQCLRH
jgi:hypothetical protein